MEEVLQIYDAEGESLGSKTRADVYAEPRIYLHGVVNIWIVNTKCELLCSKRSAHLKGNPGKWQTFFGGHVQAGESLLETAQRELEEETCIKIDVEGLHLIEKGKNETYHHFFEGYMYIYQGELLEFKDQEVSESRWMSFEEYNQEKSEHPEWWCNGCSVEKQQIITEFLKNYYDSI